MGAWEENVSLFYEVLHLGFESVYMEIQRSLANLNIKPSRCQRQGEVSAEN